ncbi:MAG TPA: hypothetical protein VJJ52_03370 [Candidatus Nanoarchaeia archaeon]|nr:hypothetical protein [Candidatus Nanoarchaeia archaeon]
MESAKSFLIEWTASFVKNKDVIAKKIENIEKNKDAFDLYVKFKDKEQFFIISPSINNLDSIIPKLKNDSHFCIVALNSSENLECLIKNWRKLIDFKFLSIIFVNPFSQLDKKWIIYPYTHHRICDESSLKTGLKSMFDMVEPIEEKEFADKII